jgi:PIN domain nuclease of toxin-antitoxin system
MEMRVLADTNLFIELFRLWQRGDVPDNPDAWLDLALPSWTILPITVPIARQSVLWSWQHKDPADRILAATAKIEGLEFWHTDTVLKKLTGFPHRYFTNVRG